MLKSLLAGHAWQCVDGKRDGRPATLCVRTDISARQRARFPVSIDVEWTFDEAGKLALPKDRDAAVIDRFERLMNEHLLSIDPPPLLIVAILTGTGFRRWIGYSPDQEVFEAAFNQMMEHQPDYPLQLSGEADPSWDLFAPLLQSVEERQARTKKRPAASDAAGRGAQQPGSTAHQTGESKAVANTLVFRHQDGDLSFPVAKAGYALTPDRRLTLSIECDENPDYEWMGSPRFCLVNLPLTAAPSAGMVVQFPGLDAEPDPDSQEPRAHIYAGEHELPRDVQVRFTRVSADACDIKLSWTQPDVKYYDKRARPTRVVGKCTLRRAGVEEMWIPQ